MATKQHTQSQSDRTSQARPLNDEPLDGSSLSPPLLLLVPGTVEIGWGIYCNFQQVNTSTEAFYSSIAAAAALGNDKSAQHLLQLEPKLHTMAFVIAFSVQLFMLANAWPISVIWQRMRQAHAAHYASGDKGSIFSAAREVSHHLTLRQWLAIIAFVGNVVGDIRYATLTTGDWFSIFMWAVFLSACATLLLLDGAQRIWGGIRSWSDFKAYHARRMQSIQPNMHQETAS